MKQVVAITEPGGMGPVLSAAAVEFDPGCTGSEEVLSALSVEGRTVLRRYWHSRPEKTADPGSGCYAVLELDPRDRAPMLREMVGHPPKAAYPVPTVTVRSSEDTMISTQVIRDVVDDFQINTYFDAASGETLQYCLFKPENMVEGEIYPLITFIHDAGSCSEEVRTGLLQGLGGVVWAEKEFQKEYPCFVLVPHYPRPIVDDDWNSTWEVEATNALIDAIAASNPVDTNRLYLTGQSMGAMTSCYLMAHYPDKWAGAYLVAGQWEAEQMASVTDTPIWYLVSDGDEKALPGMKDIAKVWEEQGVDITWGEFDLPQDPAAAEQTAKQIAASGGKVLCTIFKGDGIISPGMPRFPGVHHICTWLHAYNIPTIRNWLFGQRRS